MTLLLSIMLIFKLSQASVIWTDEPWYSGLDIDMNLVEHAEDGRNTDIQKVLADPDGLISDDFNVPQGLVERVLFWSKIYALYNYNDVVVHDRNDMSIYMVTRVPGGASYIKALIKRAASSSNIKMFLPKNKAEKELYFKIKKKLKKTTLTALIEGVRTQSGQRNMVIEGIKVSSRYLPYMEDAFVKQGLPWELTRIPFVESSFNIRAGSKVGAKGVWQIMLGIGKKFVGINQDHDERFSPFKANSVAIKLLKENYQILGTWPLAITAYNHGPGGLKQASKKFGTKDIATIVNNYKGKNFGFASQNFYSEFLAALYVTVYSDVLFGKIEKESPMNAYYVTIDEDIMFSSLCSLSELSEEDMKKYNPDLGKRITSDKTALKKGTSIKLPPKNAYLLEEYFTRATDKEFLNYRLNKELQDE